MKLMPLSSQNAKIHALESIGLPNADIGPDQNLGKSLFDDDNAHDFLRLCACVNLMILLTISRKELI